MPLIIEYIDAIGRKKKRDVLFVTFTAEIDPQVEEDDDLAIFPPQVDWENHSGRKQVIEYLDKNGIAWHPCGPRANPNVMDSYQGWIYLDVPYDVALAEYRLLETFLENPDGTMRIPHVVFNVLPLSSAMENAHHDEPGFWEDWADKF